MSTDKQSVAVAPAAADWHLVAPAEWAPDRPIGWRLVATVEHGGPQDVLVELEVMFTVDSDGALGEQAEQVARRLHQLLQVDEHARKIAASVKAAALAGRAG